MIGTKYGAGDGSTTFNLPNLIGRVLQGGNSSGTYLEAGLPNITAGGGASDNEFSSNLWGALRYSGGGGGGAQNDSVGASFNFDASRSSPIYGRSSTVQPPALTTIICIKAFGTSNIVGELNAASLAQDIANIRRDFDNKVNTYNSGILTKYVTNTWSDGTNWYRIFNDGWVEQGGRATAGNGYTGNTINLFIPMSSTNYTLLAKKLNENGSGVVGTQGLTITSFRANFAGQGGSGWTGTAPMCWEVKGFKA